MKKYEVGEHIEGLIAVVEAEAEDDRSVTIDGERWKKLGPSNSRFFDSWEKARSFLRARTRASVVRQAGALNESQELLEAIEALPEHEPHG